MNDSDKNGVTTALSLAETTSGPEKHEQARIKQLEAQTRTRKSMKITIVAAITAVFLFISWNNFSTEKSWGYSFNQAEAALSRGDYQATADEFCKIRRQRDFKSRLVESTFGELLGIYRGSYIAAQGETGLTLTVFMDRGVCKAKFEFYNLPDKNNAKSGSYYMRVSKKLNGDYFFKGTEWIDKPYDYEFVHLRGKLNNNGILEGTPNETGRYRTYEFMVTKQRVRSESPPTKSPPHAVVLGHVFHMCTDFQSAC